jgi:hypothetical protein
MPTVATQTETVPIHRQRLLNRQRNRHEMRVRSIHNWWSLIPVHRMHDFTAAETIYLNFFNWEYSAGGSYDDVKALNHWFACVDAGGKPLIAFVPGGEYTAHLYEALACVVPQFVTIRTDATEAELRQYQHDLHRLVEIQSNILQIQQFGEPTNPVQLAAKRQRLVSSLLSKKNQEAILRWLRTDILWCFDRYYTPEKCAENKIENDRAISQLQETMRRDMDNYAKSYRWS